MKLRDGTVAVMRLVHIDNLRVYLRRGALHAPNHAPDDGLGWRATHRPDVQAARARKRVPVGPGGTLLDYVPFYFGPRSPMLYQLHTGRVAGYDEGQEPLVYLVASVQDVAAAGQSFVFYDGHALATLSSCLEDLGALDRIDWEVAHGRQWANTPEDPDRQRRKQAEFLIHRVLPWQMVRGVVVKSQAAQARVLASYDEERPDHRPRVAIRPDWYYE